MSQRDPEIALRQMLDYAKEAMILSKGKSPQELVDEPCPQPGNCQAYGDSGGSCQQNSA